MFRHACVLLITVFIFFTSNAQDSLITISSDDTRTYQTIDGFGAFGAEKVWWSSPPFFDEEFVDFILDDLGCNIIRTQLYWDFEPQNDNHDPTITNLNGFNYGPNSDNGKQFDYIRALKEKGLERFIASVWTPPIWMKINTDNSLASFCEGQCGGQLNPEYYHEFAEYLATYVKVLKQETGVDLYALSIQNELRFANPFESCVYTPEQYREVLKIVRERFLKDRLTTKIFGPEDMGRSSWNEEWVNAVLERDPEAREYLDIWAVHTYLDGVAPDYGSAEGWTVIHSDAHQNDLPLWMTETSGYEQTWEGAFELARSIYLALKFGKVTAWVYWAINGEEGSEFSLLAEGNHTKNSLISKQYYQFIKPGAIQYHCESPDNEVLPLLFKNPSEGSLSMIFVNYGMEEKSVTLEVGPLPESMEMYRTSETEDYIKVMEFNGNELTLAPQSITSIIGYGPKAPSIEEVPVQFIDMGGQVEIELTGLTDGEASPEGFTIQAVSEDPDKVEVTEIQHDGSSTTARLILSSMGDTPGKTRIELTLENNNSLTADGFGFNVMKTGFDVWVQYGVTGIDEDALNRIRIYPNPVKDHLKIDFPENIYRNALVYNMLGNKIREISIPPGRDNMVFSTAGLIEGLYTIILTGRNANTQKKFLIYN